MSRWVSTLRPIASARSSRDAAKQETREALLAAAIAEFAERGLDAPSLDAICARAGFTRGAFYVHFRDREDLVAAVMERVLGAFLDAVVARGDGAGDLAAVISRFAAAVEALRDPDGARSTASESAWGAPKVPFHQVLAACQRSPALRARFVTILAEAVQRVAHAAEPGTADREGVATLLVLTALGVRLALDLELPLDVPRVRDAALALLAAPRR
jgi:AcrR family transcriptional regulator